MVVFDHGWYRQVLEDRCDQAIRKSEWLTAYQQINEFERWLADDHQLVIKFWMHISKKKQKQRFKKYLADPDLAWRVTKDYRRHHRSYDKWVPAVEEMLAKTESSYAPWTLIEANDQRWALVRIFEVLAQRIESELDRRSVPLPSPTSEMSAGVPQAAAEKRRKRSQVNGRHRGQVEVANAREARYE